MRIKEYNQKDKKKQPDKSTISGRDRPYSHSRHFLSSLTSHSGSCCIILQGSTHIKVGNLTNCYNFSASRLTNCKDEGQFNLEGHWNIFQGKTMGLITDQISQQPSQHSTTFQLMLLSDVIAYCSETIHERCKLSCSIQVSHFERVAVVFFYTTLSQQYHLHRHTRQRNLYLKP